MSAQDIFGGEESFDRYKVRVRIRDRIMGGIPNRIDLMEGWIRKNLGITDEEEIFIMVKRTYESLGKELPFDDDPTTPEGRLKAIEDMAKTLKEETQTVGFANDDDGLYIEDRCIKALLRECVNIAFAGERWGRTKKGPKSFFVERVFVEPREVHMQREEPDGTHLFIGHISDRLGKRATLTLYDYCEQPELEFELLVHKDASSVLDKHWGKIWKLAEQIGLGSLRSQSQGKFDLVGWEKVA